MCPNAPMAALYVNKNNTALMINRRENSLIKENSAPHMNPTNTAGQ
jgi:hypothetical protein